MPNYNDWRWSVDPSPYVQNIGSRLEIVNGTINGMDGQFGAPPVQGMVSDAVGGLFILGVLFIGYKYAKKHDMI